MSFRLQTNPTFVTPVTIPVPTDAGVVEETVSIRFRVVSDEEIELRVVEFLTRAILRVDDVLDDAGKPIQSSPEVIARFLALPFTRVPTVKAYWQALSGAKLGN